MSRKRLLYSLFALGVLVFVVYAIKVYFKTDYTDFSVYHRAAQRFADGNYSSVYSMDDGTSPFRYIPLSLLFFWPFSFISYASAKMVWFVLQFVFFGFGYYFLYQTLKRVKGKRLEALTVTAITVLLTLRFCLDTFTIGQVSSLMFLGFSLCLYGWMYGKSGTSGLGLSIPTVLKIGPGYLFLLLTTFRPTKRVRAFLAPLAVFAFVTLVFVLFTGIPRSQQLFNGWFHIIINDSVYYDASHYGSQSLKSFLLRLINAGYLNLYQATQIQISVSVLVCISIGLIWYTRRAKSALGRGYMFALGIFPYIWFMPETFKYGFTTLAFPLAFLLAGIPKKKSDPATMIVLTLSALTLSFAGKDLLPDSIFFGMQKLSIPFLTTVVLGLIVMKRAWSESTSKALFSFHDQVLPWDHPPAPASQIKLKASLIVPVPLRKDSRFTADFTFAWLKNTVLTLNTSLNDSFEVLVVPYGPLSSHHHPEWQKLLHNSRKFDSKRQIRVLDPPPVPTRGYALREGFLRSVGQFIFFAHIEQPCDPQFYVDSLTHLNLGTDLVIANRRLPDSRFQIPVRFLSQIYGRHKLGLMFNRLVRTVLPIPMTDTHSGSLAIWRTLALQVFCLQSSSRFLFDLEILLTCLGHNLKWKELPARVMLSKEKQVTRIVSEAVSIAYGLPRLAWRSYKGFYRTHPFAGHFQSITADDWGLSPGVNQGILELARLGIVKRVSILSTSPYWKEYISELQTVPNIELGLHFNLTYETQFKRPSHFMFKWFMSKPRNLVRSEISRQLDILKNAGVKITYLDGHHHIHLVPGVLASISDILKVYGIRYVRIPFDPTLWLSTKWVLNVLSLLALRVVRKNGFTTEKCKYPNGRQFLDQGKLRNHLLGTKMTEVIVHPAAVNDFKAYKVNEPYSSGRIIEFRALRMLSYANSVLSREL